MSTGASAKDNFFQKPFAFTGINNVTIERYTGLVPMAIASIGAAYEAKSYGLNKQALQLFNISAWCCTLLSAWNPQLVLPYSVTLGWYTINSPK